MARKRKAATRKKTRKSSPAHHNWLWLGAGLGIGLVIGLGVYFYQTLSSTPEKIPPQASAAPETASPAPKPVKKEQPPAETGTPPQKRFDFYTLLEEMEVEITDEELEQALSLLPKIDRSGTYILQVGSFRKFADADALKARLALLGIEARIEAVVNKSGNTWHRVRIGPFTDIKLMKRARRKLQNNHIDFVILKIKT